MNSAQKYYPILRLDDLAVVSTVKKFHKFLYGMHFTIYTDHKPLIGIFGKEGKNSIFFSIYNFDIVYRPSLRMGNADFCSRFPLSDEVLKELAREYIKNLYFSDEFPINHKEVARETLNDEFLQSILKYLQQGWPQRLERRFVDVYFHYQELEEVEGCVLFQDRVVIPESMKNKILRLLHMNHSGISKSTLEYMGYGTECNKVLKVLLGIFARYGLPDVVVTDGGPPFNSDKFVKFLENQGILVMESPPYYPESNGQAERTVRLVKDVLK